MGPQVIHIILESVNLVVFEKDEKICEPSEGYEASGRSEIIKK